MFLSDDFLFMWFYYIVDPVYLNPWCVHYSDLWIKHNTCICKCLHLRTSTYVQSCTYIHMTVHMFMWPGLPKYFYTCTISRFTFHYHWIDTALVKQFMCVVLLKFIQSAFTQISFSSLSDVHKCSSGLLHLAWTNRQPAN